MLSRLYLCPSRLALLGLVPVFGATEVTAEPAPAGFTSEAAVEQFQLPARNQWDPKAVQGFWQISALPQRAQAPKLQFSAGLMHAGGLFDISLSTAAATVGYSRLLGRFFVTGRFQSNYMKGVHVAAEVQPKDGFFNALSFFIKKTITAQGFTVGCRWVHQVERRGVRMLAQANESYKAQSQLAQLAKNQAKGMYDPAMHSYGDPMGSRLRQQQCERILYGDPRANRLKELHALQDRMEELVTKGYLTKKQSQLKRLDELEKEHSLLTQELSTIENKILQKEAQLAAMQK